MFEKTKRVFAKTFFRCDCIEGRKIIEEEWKKYKANNAILIDVRSPQEFKEGHIKGAISIPYYDLYNSAKEVLKEKNQTIIVYCNTGSRSSKAVRILKRQGYTNVKEACKDL